MQWKLVMAKMGLKHHIIGFLLLFLVGCGENFHGRDQDLATLQNDDGVTIEDVGPDLNRIQSHRREEAPIKVTEGQYLAESDYKVITGRLQLFDITYRFDKSKKEMGLSGDIAFTIGGGIQKFPFKMTGKLDKNSGTLLIEDEKSNLRETLKANVYCDSETCEDFRIDLYYLDSHNKKIYKDSIFPKFQIEDIDRNHLEEVPAKEVPVQVSPPSLDAPGSKGDEKKPSTPSVPSQDKETPKNQDSTKATEPSKTPKPSPTPAPSKSTAPAKTEESKKTNSGEASLSNGLEEFLGPDEYTDEDAERIMKLFKEVQNDVDKKITEAKKKPAPENPPVKSPSKSVEPVPLKPLGTATTGLPDKVVQVLKSLPSGVPQATGIPVKGKGGQEFIVRRLKNAVYLPDYIKLLDPNSGLRISKPNKLTHYGTSHLVNLVLRIGQWIQENVPGFKMDVGNLSKKNGGKVNEVSVSHMNGLDADLGYVFKDTNQSSQLRDITRAASNVLLEKQWELFKALIHDGNTNVIIVDIEMKKALCKYVKSTNELKNPQTAEFARKVLGLVKYETDDEERRHIDHFHLRVTCGPDKGKLCDDQIQRLQACP